jgi:hypothetical protein
VVWYWVAVPARGHWELQPLAAMVVAPVSPLIRNAPVHAVVFDEKGEWDFRIMLGSDVPKEGFWTWPKRSDARLNLDGEIKSS